MPVLRHETQLMREPCLVEDLRDRIDARAAIPLLLADEEHVTLDIFLCDCIIRIEVTGGKDIEVRCERRMISLRDLSVTRIEMYRQTGIARWLLRRAGTDRRVVKGAEIATRVT